jgi:hypothetical protein
LIENNSRFGKSSEKISKQKDFRRLLPSLG